MRVKLLECRCGACGYSARVAPVRFRPLEGERCPACDRGTLGWRVVRGSPEALSHDRPLEAVLAQFPRLCAHLVCESLGYLSPLAAANLLWHLGAGREFGCEWIVDLRTRGVTEPTRAVVRRAVRNRHMHRGPMADYGTARAIVGHVLATGKNPDFGSWF